MKTVHLRGALSATIALLLSLMLPLSAFAGGSWSGVLPLKTSGSMSAPLAGPTIALSSYDLTVGQTATVTFTFPAAPLQFTASDTSATNGTISNLVASTTNSDVYTATFTPNANADVGTNVISVKGKVVGTTYHDASFEGPYSLAFDGTNMWVTNSNSTTIDKITPSGTISVYAGFDGPSGIAFDGTHLWVTNYGSSAGVGSGNGTTVREVALSGTIIGSPITVAQAPTAIAFDGSNMWAASYVDGTSPGIVTEIASTSAILQTATTSPGPNGIAFDGTNIWTANFGSNNNGDGDSVTKISPTGTSTSYVGTENGPSSIAFDGTNMWVANYGLLDYEGPNFTDLVLGINGNSVTKVSSSGAMTTYTGAGDEPAAIAYDGTNMWTANYDGLNADGGSVTEVAPNGSMVTYTGVGYNPVGIAYDGTNMWVANNNEYGISGGDSVTKITGVISPATSANYVVDTIPPSDSGTYGGGSVTSQVRYLTSTGNTSAAQALEAQWPNLFPSVTTSSASSITSSTPSTTTIPITVLPIATPPIAEVGSSPSATSTTFTRYLERGMTGREVQMLQQYLNSHGFTITAEGSGSPGHETQYFGTLTQNALVKFQEAHAAEILAPFNLSAGTGVLGPSTITFITSH